MSTIKVNTIQNTSGVQQYLAKAWVNFDGSSTVSIRDDGNVSSITDNTTGDYSINFSSTLSASTYNMCSGSTYATDGTKGAVCLYGGYNGAASSQTTSALKIATGAANQLTRTDFQHIYVSIFL